jgi:hypothetical protein
MDKLESFFLTICIVNINKNALAFTIQFQTIDVLGELGLEIKYKKKNI